MEITEEEHVGVSCVIAIYALITWIFLIGIQWPATLTDCNHPKYRDH